MKLGIVYHMPFWRASDGRLRELEGSFARYVDSLAPYFDEVSLCVPMLTAPRGEGTAIQSVNVTVSALPPFDGPLQFYRQLGTMAVAIARWARTVDVLHCRVPTPAAAFAAAARRRHCPLFVLVVGDLRALLPTVRYSGAKRVLWRAYTEFEERSVQWMVDRALTFANGPALASKHARPGRPVIQTTTTTIRESDIADRTDCCNQRPLRMLTVSRIDPRKGLRVLPETVAVLLTRGIDATLDIVGPPVGQPGEAECAAILAAAARYSVPDHVSIRDAVPLDALLPLYRAYDVFVLPTLPGEGIPRVLLEAMSGGVPVVTTPVAGITGLITHGQNGLLVPDPTAHGLADAIQQIVSDQSLRQGLIAAGYETARRFTLGLQAARMMDAVARELRVPLARPAVLPAA